MAVLDAKAQDEPIELADDPFEITDPFAAPPGHAEVGVVGYYERARRGRTRGTGGLETELELGIAPGLELRLGQFGAFGNLETRRRLDAAVRGEEQEGPAAWGGATQLGALYQIADGRGAMPALGLLGRVRMIYGPGRPAQEAEFVALAGKTLHGGALPLGLHVNLGWTARLDPLPGERPNFYLFNASVGQAVARDTAVVLTYAREQQERGQRDYELVQAGLRHQLPDGGPVLGFALGAGIGRDSPSFQLAFAVQWSLGSFR
jgi:hypothetical protein